MYKLTHLVAVSNERQCVTVCRSYCRNHPISNQNKKKIHNEEDISISSFFIDDADDENGNGL